MQFFISRAGEDREWGIWVALILKEAGHDYYLQDHDILPGHSFPHQEREAMERSDHFIALLSPDYIAKDHTMAELTSAYALDPMGRKRMLLLVRVRECEIPKLLAHFVYLDLRVRDEAAKRVLLARIDRTRPTKATYRSFIAKLPTVDPTLIGRENEIAFLDQAWSDPATNFVQIIAAGGTGKTALVDKWFRRHFDEATVFGWSFYSQGTSENRQTSSDPFFAEVLQFFKITVEPTASVYAKAEALARHMREERVLLILDGLDPLQDSSGSLRDSGLKALLQELSTGNQGLVVCTTSVRVSDILDDAPRTRSIELDNLDPAHGAEYLRKLGVQGTDDELQTATSDYANHALALTLLGTYLVDFCNADVRRRIEIPKLIVDEVKHGVHARHVMEAYARMFAGKPELDILRGLGYFDRPAEPAALKLVLPAMPDLKYRAALKRLRDARLILTADPSASIDCHPLIREYFAEVMRSAAPEAFRDGHSRLYEYYLRQAPRQPDTIEEMTPLFYAVYHGCQAGRHVEARRGAYCDRILRGDEFYLTRKLGAFGTDLSLLANFFESPWIQPVPALSPADQSWVVGTAALALRALGRLADAVGPMRAAAEAFNGREDWKNSANSYGNLSELYLTLGDLVEATATARLAINFAERSGDVFERIVDRARLADVLHQSGALVESASLFQEAERLQAERQPDHPFLYSLQGYRYCDLLFTQGQTAEVVRRGTQSLPIAQHNHWLLDIGLDHLSLGRAHPPGSPESATHLDQAVDYLRRAGTLHHLPRALLARGTPHDLDEVHALSTRSGMRLFLADYHLAMARLADTSEHVQEAEALVRETGYHRRDPDITVLRRELQATIVSSKVPSNRSNWAALVRDFFAEAGVASAESIMWPPQAEIPIRQVRRRLYVLFSEQVPTPDQIQELRDERNIEPVVISLVRIERALSEGTCAQTLAEIAEPFTIRKDPYDEGVPVKDETWFYGRRDLLDRLPGTLRQGQHAALFGIRKVGKTSLLNQLRERLLRNTPTVLLDCQGFEADADEYFDAILQGFRKELSRRIGRLPEAKGSFREQLVRLHAASQRSGLFEGFILILDEADKLFPDRRQPGAAKTLSEAVRLFRRLRAISQEHRCLSLLLSAYRADLNRHNLLGTEIGENPLHLSLQENFLKFLTPAESRSMVREIGLWKDIKWTDSALDQTYKWCAGHPLMTRFFASEACEQGGRKQIDDARVAEVATVVKRNFDKHRIGAYIRESIWRILYEDEQACLRRISAQEPLTKDLEEARTNMEEFGLIDECGQIQGDLIRQWLERL